jgi:hypothetical protein
MKTLADLKRAMEVGTKWKGVNHYYPCHFGVRPITKKNSVGVYFETVREDRIVECLLEWPKASNVEFGEDGEVKIFCKWGDDERYHLLSYWKM